MVPPRVPNEFAQAPSATDSAAVIPSVRIQPAHREG